MKSLYRNTLLAAGAGLLTAAAACSRDATPTGAQGAVPATIVLAQASVTGTTLTPIGVLSDVADSDGMGNGFHGRIGLSDVDSITANITKVEVHVELPDTENAADSAAEAAKDSTHHEDEDKDDEHENDEATWVSLDVTAGGHVNLLKLPDSASGGITIATGTLAPGKYKHVRLFVTDAMIFLKNQIVTPNGDTLKAGVGIAVKIPSADSTGAAVKTDQSFTVPTGGGTVKLVFDADDTVRHIVVTGDGTIILPPVLRARGENGEH